MTTSYSNPFNSNPSHSIKKGDRVRFINSFTGEVSQNEGIFDSYTDGNWCSVCYSYGSTNQNRIVDIFKSR